MDRAAVEKVMLADMRTGEGIAALREAIKGVKPLSSRLRIDLLPGNDDLERFMFQVQERYKIRPGAIFFVTGDDVEKLRFSLFDGDTAICQIYGLTVREVLIKAAVYVWEYLKDKGKIKKKNKK